MTAACCESHGESPRAVRACRECGTACCRSCAIEIDTNLYCRWCAGSIAPSRAA